MAGFVHKPVMTNEVMDFLKPSPGKFFLDCTVGGGGHAKSILTASRPDGFLFGLDRDLNAIEAAQENLSEFKGRFELHHVRYSNMTEVLNVDTLQKIDGVLIDCGVSSHQLDSPDRGFSFQNDAPLDMRMNQLGGPSAADFLQSISEKDLADVIYQFGEERNSRKIAKNIIQYRKDQKLHTTFDLVDAIKKSFPFRHYWKTNPATKTFQAIRMAVNEELYEIEKTISFLLQTLEPGSRLVVITFHSLEDRLVKNLFRQASNEKKVQLLTKKPLSPSKEELDQNPRSRSAKVRAFEVLA